MKKSEFVVVGFRTRHYIDIHYTTSKLFYNGASCYYIILELQCFIYEILFSSKEQRLIRSNTLRMIVAKVTKSIKYSWQVNVKIRWHNKYKSNVKGAFLHLRLFHQCSLIVIEHCPRNELFYLNIIRLTIYIYNQNQ